MLMFILPCMKVKNWINLNTERIDAFVITVLKCDVRRLLSCAEVHGQPSS